MRNEKLGRYVEEPVAEYQGPKSIPYQIELFEKNLNRLQEIVVQLEGRLSPLMRPLVQQDCDHPPDSNNNSPLSRHLSSLNTTLERTITNLCVVHDSLEI